MRKFKIDMTESSGFPFGLYVWKRCRYSLFGFKEWCEVDRFKTRDEARVLHAVIKDLPEYLA